MLYPFDNVPLVGGVNIGVLCVLSSAEYLPVMVAVNIGDVLLPVVVGINIGDASLLVMVGINIGDVSLPVMVRVNVGARHASPDFL